jgi:DNA-binding response OmpR family regulator
MIGRKPSASMTSSLSVTPAAVPAPEPPRVLVVEDESDIREVIGLILDATAIPHDDAEDGAEALERLDDRTYDALIPDLMMPRVDGFAVIQRVAVTDPRLLGRTIVMSGGTSEVIAKVDDRVYRVMRKPFSPGDLVNAIRAALARGTGRGW